MTDRDALFAAICANPDDDTPRLVFADFLEENGQPQQAAFIRAEVELHRRDAAVTPAASVRRFLEATRFSDLGDIDWSRPDAELGAMQALARVADDTRIWPALRSYGLPRLRGVEFRHKERGFHSGVRVDKPAAFLKHARDLFRATPVNHVWFAALTTEQAREFVAAGYLGRLRRLALGREVEPEAIRVIGNHSDAAGVSWLDFYGGDDVGEQIAELLAGRHWSGVTQLELLNLDSDNTAGPDRLLADVLCCPAFRRVRHLDVAANDLDDVAARTIARAGLTELRYLDLSYNAVSESGATALAGSKSLPNLRDLDLTANEIGGVGAAALIVSRKLPHLTVLDLDGSEVRGPDPKVLASANRGPTLRVLSLAWSNLTARGLAALGKCRAAQGLWFLSFQGCGLTDAQLAAFTKTAALGQLTAFDLENNALSARGMQALACWPGAASLQSIDISENHIGEAGAKALVESPYLKGLRRINASGRGTARLRKHFGKKVVPHE